MKKIAIILDSFCGRDKKTVEKLADHYYLPLRIIINGKEYYDDGTTIDAESLMKEANMADDVKTSQPSPAMTEELFEKLSKEYENVVYLCLGSALSGTFQTASVISKEYKNVHVINNFLVGKSFVELSTWLHKEAEAGKPIKELISFADKYGSLYPAYVIPKNNKAFIRSGRLGKATAFMLQKMNAVPIIGYEDKEKLHKKMIKRSGAKAIEYALDKLFEKVKDKNNTQVLITHTLDEEFVNIARKKIQERGFDVITELATGVINGHTGDGSISISAYDKLK